MKRIISIVAAAALVLPATAQTPDTARFLPKPHCYTTDADLAPWFVDVNGKVGALWLNPTTKASLAPYPFAVNGVNNLGKLTFNDGMSYGGDAQVGYFFGKSHHWGVGAGFMYLYQKANANLDGYHVEYQATDRNGDVYRAVTTGHNLQENVKMTNLNIPVVLKYKNRFSKLLGVTVDAGVLYNVSMTNKTTTNASFDYGAIYQYDPELGKYVYDASPIPGKSDVIFTPDFANTKNPAGVYQYFQQGYNSGKNVGIGVRPDAQNLTQTVKYNTGSWGFIFQPGVSFYLSDHVALNLEAYYIYQAFQNNPQSNYRLTGAMGEYSSVLNSVSKSENHSVGGNIGVRFLFGKAKDSDHDGIPDKKDKCPYTRGLAVFMGCPDTDNDGIPDPEDACPTVPGLVQFHGCPDTDGDGIPDKDDECPLQAGPAKFHGCPDRDNDGIPDKDDACPDQPGPAQFHGCPDTDGDGVPDNIDRCPNEPGPASNNGCPVPPPPPPVETVPLSTPILFEVNKTTVHESSMPVLETAIKTLNEDKSGGIIIIDGYTDNTGSKGYNRKLSMKRANAVKKQLVKMGADPKRIKIVGHGSSNPATSNKTKEGRLQNRRAVMRLKV